MSKYILTSQLGFLADELILPTERLLYTLKPYSQLVFHILEVAIQDFRQYYEVLNI